MKQAERRRQPLAGRIEERRGPVPVVHYCPGGREHGGGIGRMVGGIQDAAGREGWLHAVVDTRGPRWSWVGSPARLMMAAANLVWARVATPECVHHIHVAGRGSTARKLVLAAVARGVGCRHVLHLHDYDYAADVLRRPAWLQRRIAAMFQAADRVIVLGRRDRDVLMRQLGVPEDRVATLPNSVPDPGARGPRPPDGPTTILFLGRLSDRKGVPELLEALAHPEMLSRSWRAVLAGDGPVATYRARAAELGLGDRVVMPGWLGEAEVDALGKEADILVLPSHAEGLAMAVLEGLAQGLAVVTTRVGAHEEVLQHEVTGLFVPVGDPDALAQALARLLDDPALRARLSSAGRTLYQERFGIDGYMGRLERLYRSLTAPKLNVLEAR
ncbi:glycosyltransferase family 4 protein [Rubellimicrobium arenae]|uniref:glycosyltransferase family 4 protein n=1 Tax=Rubellimicrobium arenae TaxID=2817372 RepID=UPI001B315084|nr:glycosyltransferase family 4 protein [Rubellimicrobium arenae]